MPSDVMRYRKWAAYGLFAIAYAGLLLVGCYTVIWKPSKAGKVSVARDGQFITGTYYLELPLWRNCVRHFSEDLSRSRLVSTQGGMPVHAAFGISSDGERLVAVDEDEFSQLHEVELTSGRVLNRYRLADLYTFDVAYVANDQHLLCLQADEGIRRRTMSLRISDGEVTQVSETSANVVLNGSADEIAIADFPYPKNEMTTFRWVDGECVQQAIYSIGDREIGTQWSYNDGKLAYVAEAGAVHLVRDLINDPQRVVVVQTQSQAEVNGLTTISDASVQFDQQGDLLAVLTSRGVSIIDVEQANVVAEKKFPYSRRAISTVFQDPDHVIIVVSSGDDENDEVIRWNRRTDQTSAASLGTLERSAVQSLKTFVSVASLLWLIAFVIHGLRQRDRMRPMLDIGSLFVASTVVLWLTFRIHDSNKLMWLMLLIGNGLAILMLLAQWAGFCQLRLAAPTLALSSAIAVCAFVMMTATQTRVVRPLSCCLAIVVCQLLLVWGARLLGWRLTTTRGLAGSVSIRQGARKSISWIYSW